MNRSEAIDIIDGMFDDSLDILFTPEFKKTFDDGIINKDDFVEILIGNLLNYEGNM